MNKLTQDVLNKHYCIRDFRIQVTTESKGIKMADGILGLSPQYNGRHSFLAELKVAGLIDHTMVSFDNAFYRGTPLLKQSTANQSQISTVIFGGYNESAIVGGAAGLFNCPLSSEKVNPNHFWGIEGWGFSYGDNIIMDPSDYVQPINAVIDSGTTLVIFPQDMYETLMEQLVDEFKDDSKISLVCQRVK